MKLAVLSESAADSAAVHILTEGVLGSNAELVSPKQFQTRSGGWPSVVNIAPALLKHLHYRTDAEALVVVVDSNDSPVHSPAHDAPDGPDEQCRLCRLRRVISDTVDHLAPRQHAATLRTAIGIAVPAIEAWYLCGKDPHVSEAAWTTDTAGYTRRTLKKSAYGTSRPTLVLETQVAITEAQRLTEHLDVLEQHFPVGFGALAQDIRDWDG